MCRKRFVCGVVNLETQKHGRNFSGVPAEFVLYALKETDDLHGQDWILPVIHVIVNLRYKTVEFEDAFET
jgi:hypothetical protein